MGRRILKIVAVVLFIIAALGLPIVTFNLVALGLALWLLAEIS